MVVARSSQRARVLLAGAALLLLTGCGPVPIGLTAVSQRDGHLLIALIRCDDTTVKRAAIEHRGPLRGTDTPRESFDDARWSTDQGADIIILDTSRPGVEWTTEKALGDLDASTAYTASAGGELDEPMASVGFTQGEVAALAEGQWLYPDDGQRPDTVVRPTTNDLAGLRDTRCNG